MIQSTTSEITAQFGPKHWRMKEENGELLQDLWSEFMEGDFQGMLISQEYDVERWWREINHTRLATAAQQMAHNHISQELCFPKSY